jgi:hypothetical protein
MLPPTGQDFSIKTEDRSADDTTTKKTCRLWMDKTFTDIPARDEKWANVRQNRKSLTLFPPFFR